MRSHVGLIEGGTHLSRMLAQPAPRLRGPRRMALGDRPEPAVMSTNEQVRQLVYDDGIEHVRRRQEEPPAE